MTFASLYGVGDMQLSQTLGVSVASAGQKKRQFLAKVVSQTCSTCVPHWLEFCSLEPCRHVGSKS